MSHHVKGGLGRGGGALAETVLAVLVAAAVLIAVLAVLAAVIR